MNTNSRNASSRLDPTDYRDAIENSMLSAIEFPTAFTRPRPSTDPNYVSAVESSFVKAGSSADIQLWVDEFKITHTVWGKAEQGEKMRFHHMHAVLVIRHLNFMRIDRPALGRLITAADPRLVYVRVDLIKNIDAIRAIFYAEKEGYQDEIEEVVYRNMRTQKDVVDSLKRWWNDFKQRHPPDNSRHGYGDNNNNNNVADYGSDGGGGGAVDFAPPVRRQQRRVIRDDLSTWDRVRSSSAPAPVYRSAPRANRPVTRAYVAQAINRPVTRSAAKKVARSAPRAPRAPQRGRPRSSRRR